MSTNTLQDLIKDELQRFTLFAESEQIKTDDWKSNMKRVFYCGTKGFALGYVFHAAIQLAQGLIKNFIKTVKNPIRIIKLLFSMKSLKFAMFPFVYNTILSFLQFFLNKIFKNQKKLNSLLAGAISGFFALSTKEKKQRSFLAVTFLSRSIDCILTSLINRKFLPNYPQLIWGLIFCSNWFLIGWCYGCEPSVLGPATARFNNRFYCDDISDSTFRCLAIQKYNKQMSHLKPVDPYKYLHQTKPAKVFQFQTI